ncbi:MAG: hypothetical protein QXU18_01325 [Thermoplasmatales archaeon]
MNILPNSVYELNSSDFNSDMLDRSLFFSTMHIRNELYESRDINKILEFYKSFKKDLELIDWMRARPYGNSKIWTFDGDRDVVVVIPTIDHSLKYPQSCLNDIFKGMTVIFVESGKNLYFNFAHNVNIGIMHALKLQPKWIVVSNDDMYRIDEPGKLKEELIKLSQSEVDLAIPDNGDVGYISKYRYIVKALFPLVSRFKPFIGVEKEFSIKYRFYLRERKIMKKLENVLFIKKIYPIKFLGSFFALNSNYCNKVQGKVFDETYINGFEDIDLVIRSLFESIKVQQIGYKIGDLGGQSLGRGKIRSNYKGVLNRVYFNFKYSEFISNIKNSDSANL